MWGLATSWQSGTALGKLRHGTSMLSCYPLVGDPGELKMSATPKTLTVRGAMGCPVHGGLEGLLREGPPGEILQLETRVRCDEKTAPGPDPPMETPQPSSGCTPVTPTSPAEKVEWVDTATGARVRGPGCSSHPGWRLGGGQQASPHHDSRRGGTQQHGKVQVVDVREQPGPEVRDPAARRGVRQLQPHPGQPQRQPRHQAPESSLQSKGLWWGGRSGDSHPAAGMNSQGAAPSSQPSERVEQPPPVGSAHHTLAQTCTLHPGLAPATPAGHIMLGGCAWWHLPPPPPLCTSHPPPPWGNTSQARLLSTIIFPSSPLNSLSPSGPWEQGGQGSVGTTPCPHAGHPRRLPAR